MANENQLSHELNAQDLKEILNALQLIQTKLGFLVNLTPEERQAYPKMGDKTVAFVGKALEYAKDNQEFVPNYMDMQEFEKDMNLLGQLQKILRPIRKLEEGLSDTIMLAGSESYTAARVFYNSVKNARELNVTGVDTIYQDLQERFPGRGPSKVVSTEEAGDS